MIEVEKVSNSVWAHTKGQTRCNVAFIKLEKSTAVVDSGMDPVTAQKLRATAGELTGLPVRYLILTHHHSDHIFGNQAFEDCEIISSQATYDAIAKQKETYWTKEKLREYAKDNPDLAEKWKNLKIVLPNKTFTNELVIKEGNKQLRIVEVNGHTAGSSFVYVPWDKVVIAGDLLFTQSWPYGGDPTADPYVWIEALQKLKNLDIDKVVPGHGPVISKKEIGTYLNFLNQLVSKIEEFVQRGMSKEEIINSADIPTLPYPEDERIKRFKVATLEHFYDAIKKEVNRY